MKNLLKAAFSFSGLSLTIKVIKALLIIGVLLLIVFKVLLPTWQYIARNEPTTKRTINQLYQDKLNISDSLRTVEKQIKTLSYQIQYCDSTLYATDQALKAVTARETQHQRNERDMAQLIAQYRKIGVCYIEQKVKVGFLKYEMRVVEVNCDSLRNK